MSSLLNALWPSNSRTESTQPRRDDVEAHDPRSAPPLAIPCTISHRLHKDKHSLRTSLLPGELSMWGWPSRGGVIVLDDPTPPDFEFLGLDPLDPPVRRDADQDAEDAFCRGLLRLGATWWDSQERRLFVRNLAQRDEEAVEDADAGVKPLPTRRERRWVRVAWPSDRPGSLCVVARETNIMGFEDNKNLVPTDAGRVALARNMDERCTVMQRLGGSLYDSIDDYDESTTFLKAWEENKDTGEVGPLVQALSTSTRSE